jgi:hypothetical protein
MTLLAFQNYSFSGEKSVFLRKGFLEHLTHSVPCVHLSKCFSENLWALLTNLSYKIAKNV